MAGPGGSSAGHAFGDALHLGFAVSAIVTLAFAVATAALLQRLSPPRYAPVEE